MKICQTNYFGTVNVLNAADTDWDSKYRIEKSLYARRVSFLYNKVIKQIKIPLQVVFWMTAIVFLDIIVFNAIV